MVVLMLPLGIELQHASEHHGHNHCDVTVNHFDSHDENCSHLHFLSKVNAIDFENSEESTHTSFFCSQIIFTSVEVENSTVTTTQERGPPFLLFS